MNEKANIQLIQGAFECFGRGDLAGILATLADDVEWCVAPVENVPYTGTRVSKPTTDIACCRPLTSSGLHDIQAAYHRAGRIFALDFNQGGL